jgi:hypothetical protein
MGVPCTIDESQKNKPTLFKFYGSFGGKSNDGNCGIRVDEDIRDSFNTETHDSKAFKARQKAFSAHPS